VRVVRPTSGPVQEYEVWQHQAGGGYHTSLFICRLRLPVNMYAPIDGVFGVIYSFDPRSERRAAHLFFYNDNEGVSINVGPFPYPPGLDVVNTRCPACEVRAGQLLAVLGPGVVLPLEVSAGRASVEDAIRYLHLIFR
jgi:hypothetical protein